MKLYPANRSAKQALGQISGKLLKIDTSEEGAKLYIGHPSDDEEMTLIIDLDRNECAMLRTTMLNTTSGARCPECGGPANHPSGSSMCERIKITQQKE